MNNTTEGYYAMLIAFWVCIALVSMGATLGTLIEHLTRPRVRR